MVSRAATFPAFGIDTVQVLDAEACRFLVKEGYLFAVRYLGGIKKEELPRAAPCGWIWRVAPGRRSRRRRG